MTTRIPRSVRPAAEMKKGDHKDTVGAHKADGIIKPLKENIQKKNVASKVHKEVSSRYGQHSELKGRNQHLTAANEELHRNLTGTQQRVEDLTLQIGRLEKENVEVHKTLKDCHTLLIAAKIDPVLGERVGESARQSEDERKEVMSVSGDLLNEIKAFGDIASQQRRRLEEIQTTMANLMEARGHMMQERESFTAQAAEMEDALKEAEALLL